VASAIYMRDPTIAWSLSSSGASLAKTDRAILVTVDLDSEELSSSAEVGELVSCSESSLDLFCLVCCLCWVGQKHIVNVKE
jgi:hypothetical protein